MNPLRLVKWAGQYVVALVQLSGLIRQIRGAQRILSGDMNRLINQLESNAEESRAEHAEHHRVMLSEIKAIRADLKLLTQVVEKRMSNLDGHSNLAGVIYSSKAAPERVRGN